MYVEKEMQRCTIINFKHAQLLNFAFLRKSSMEESNPEFQRNNRINFDAALFLDLYSNYVSVLFGNKNYLLPVLFQNKK